VLLLKETGPTVAEGIAFLMVGQITGGTLRIRVLIEANPADREMPQSGGLELLVGEPFGEATEENGEV
jgi:hypothetical protein